MSTFVSHSAREPNSTREVNTRGRLAIRKYDPVLRKNMMCNEER